MTEDFLHYLWKHQNFNAPLGPSSKGQVLKVIHPGYHNHDSGPDFLEAKIYLDDQLWVGQVELHVRASDWYRHQHQLDASYQNVILHVVYDDDQEVKLASGEVLPCISLQGSFDEYLYWRFEQLLQNPSPIACASQFKEVEGILKSSMIDRMIAERLQQKTLALEQILKETKGDWQESFYRFLAYGLGLKVNTEPMLVLGRSCPSRLWQRMRGDQKSLEALFLGQAGLLKDEDDYSKELAEQYRFLMRKNNLEPMDARVWKYSRMRPPSFPDYRIAQLVGLLRKQQFLGAELLEIQEEDALEKWFELEGGDYWKHHYRLGKPSAREHNYTLGINTYQSLVINVVVPYLFLYAKKKDAIVYQERALGFLQALPAEENKITRIFEPLGMKAVSALESQAILQWYKFYCTPKKCLNCSVGNQLIKAMGS